MVWHCTYSQEVAGQTSGGHGCITNLDKLFIPLYHVTMQYNFVPVVWQKMPLFVNQLAFIVLQVRDRVFDIFMFFVRISAPDIGMYALRGLGM